MDNSKLRKRIVPTLKKPFIISFSNDPEADSGNGEGEIIHKDCVHHWRIEVSDGPKSEGHCINCNGKRDFLNDLQNDFRRETWDDLSEIKRYGRSLASMIALRINK